MSLGFSAAVFVVCLILFWKAEAVGRAVRSLDGDKLGRNDTGAFGGGPKAYTFFVRFASGPLALLMAAVFVRAALS